MGAEIDLSFFCSRKSSQYLSGGRGRGRNCRHLFRVGGERHKENQKEGLLGKIKMGFFVQCAPLPPFFASAAFSFLGGKGME